MNETDYSRHTGTLFDATRLRNLFAVVVGAGALGNEVCRVLGLLGAGKVLIVDPDDVEPSNLTRSVLFRLEDYTGRNKADALAHASARIFPDSRWEHMPVAMADAGLGFFAGADIIFGCVDSDLARIEIAVAGLRLNVPVADGGLGAEGEALGRVSLYVGRDAACYVCQLIPGVRARLLGSHFQKRYSCTEDRDPGARVVPSTPTIASIVGALQVDRAIRFLAAPGGRRASRSVELRLDDSPEILSLWILRDPECPFHRDPGKPVALESAGTRFVDILRSVGDRDSKVVLDWPVCTAARCRACGHRWAPNYRLGLFRVRGRCPGCDSPRITVLERVSEIGWASPHADQPASGLGFTAGHVFFVRGA